MNQLFTTSQQTFEHFEQFVEQISDERSLRIECTLVVEHYKNKPSLYIAANDNIIFNQQFGNGHYCISTEYLYNNETEINLKIGMQGKEKNDTKVDADGIILKDTFIQIKELCINDFQIHEDYDFYRNILNTNLGFWDNSAIDINFKIPFSIWYCLMSNKNTTPADAISNTRYADFNKDMQELSLALKKLTV